MKICALIISVIITTSVYSQPFTCGENIKDARDNQLYKTVKIGSQCWMAENLNFGHFVHNHNQLDNNITEKTCYENDPQNCRIYGGLYTWDEAMAWGKTDKHQGICPAGWQIPSVGQWKELIDFLGNDSSGYKMKVNPENDPGWDGNNESNFSALPGGGGYDEFFLRKGSWSLFWAADENCETRAWFTQLDNYWYPSPPKYHSLYIGDYYKKFNGMSLRCIKIQN